MNQQDDRMHQGEEGLDMIFERILLAGAEMSVGMERVYDRRYGQCWIELELFDKQMNSKGNYDLEGKEFSAESLPKILPGISTQSAAVLSERLKELPVTLKIQ